MGLVQPAAISNRKAELRVLRPGRSAAHGDDGRALAGATAAGLDRRHARCRWPRARTRRQRHLRDDPSGCHRPLTEWLLRSLDCNAACHVAVEPGRAIAVLSPED